MNWLRAIWDCFRNPHSVLQHNLHLRRSLLDMTDLELPAARRTYAMMWEARYLKKVIETARMHKAIRKLHRRMQSGIWPSCLCRSIRATMS